MPLSDADCMARAVELSLRGFPAPNPHVGCVIVHKDEVVGEGYHDHAGAPHAEAMALQHAGSRAKGAAAYVTLEPCNHQGRTPPCSRALIEAGISRVVYAVADSNPRASGGAQALAEAGVQVESGLLAQEASLVNRQFLESARLQRPYVTVKAAVTLDGFAARDDGTSKWITGEAARADAHRIRAERGCVLVGRGTVSSDDPLLTARVDGVTNQPVRVVIDPMGKLSGTEKVFGPESQTVWLTRIATKESQTEWDGRIPGALELLWESGVTGVLVEGGPSTIGRFLASGTVDEVVLYVAPVAFGTGLCWTGGYASDLRDLGLALQSAHELDGDVRLTYFRP